MSPVKLSDYPINTWEGRVWIIDSHFAADYITAGLASANRKEVQWGSVALVPVLAQNGGDGR